MATVLEYTLSLKDLITAKVQKITIANEAMLNSWGTAEQKVIKAQRAFNDMGMSVYTLGKRIESLRAERDLLPVGSLSAIRKYNSEITQLERRMTKLQTLNGSKIKTWFKDAFSSLPGLATNPLVLAGAGLGKAVKMGMEADLQKTNILTLVKGDAQKAKALYQDLSQYGIKTPYEKAGLIEAQKTLMSFGLSAEKSFGVLRQIGDIALGDAGKMQSLSLAFAQATSAGKLQGQDLLQMINAGFNPLQIISEKTGESMASLKERMSKGTIGAQELSQAFAWATEKGGLFYQGAERASQTLGGKWSNMADALSEMALKIYEAVKPLLLPIIVLATRVFEIIGEGIGWFVDKLQEGGPVISVITFLISVFVGVLAAYKIGLAAAAFFQNKLTWAVIKTNLAFLANPITWIIAGITALIGLIAYLIMKIDGWGKQWDAIVKFMKLTFQAFVEAVKLYFSTLINGIMIGIDKIILGWYKFKQAVGLGDTKENQAAMARINADVEARQKAITEGAKKVVDLGKQAKNALTWELTWNDKSLSDIIKETKSKLGFATEATATNTESTSIDTKDNAVVDTTNNIVSGGKRQTNFNITIQRLQDDTKIFVSSVEKGIEDMGEKVREELLRAINSINQIQTA